MAEGTAAMAAVVADLSPAAAVAVLAVEVAEV
jgi:hypothetical protein